MGLLDRIKETFSRGSKPPARKAAQTGDISLGTDTKAAKKPATTKSSNDVTVKTGGKKKKATEFKADVNEEALDFSISLKNSDSRKRNAIRITLDDLEIYIHRLNKKFPVTNISATGLGFSFEKPRIKGGVILAVDIVHEGEVKAKNVTCKVMHHEKGAVGCKFVELDRPQDDAVNKLVLLGQKLQAERRKQGMKAQPKPTKL